jgi:hypothetical protein
LGFLGKYLEGGGVFCFFENSNPALPISLSKTTRVIRTVNKNSTRTMFTENTSLKLVLDAWAVIVQGAGSIPDQSVWKLWKNRHW